MDVNDVKFDIVERASTVSKFCLQNWTFHRLCATQGPPGGTACDKVNELIAPARSHDITRDLNLLITIYSH